MDGISIAASAETAAAARRTEAREAAEQILTEARQKAREAAEAADREARSEAERILKAAHNTAQVQVHAILESAKIECASIERDASAHMAEAAAKITERIVGN